MKTVFSFLAIVILMFVCGCEQFRFAPSEVQKQNAWLHNKTVDMVDDKIQAEDLSDDLKALSNLSTVQSESFVSYFGMPQEVPYVDDAADILDDSNFEIAEKSLGESVQRPDFWNLAEGGLDLAIAVSALLGGAYGSKVVSYLQTAREKSQALKEIIQNNEVLKSQSSTIAEEFKKAQSGQSPETKQLVTQIKSES